MLLFEKAAGLENLQEKQNSETKILFCPGLMVKGNFIEQQN